MKKPIATVLSLQSKESSFFRNYDATIYAVCVDFASEINKQAVTATSIVLEVSLSPFPGSRQVFCDSCCVSLKKSNLISCKGKVHGLPISGTIVYKQMFGKDWGEEYSIKRFYVKVSVV